MIQPSRHASVQIDLSRIRQNAEQIARSTVAALIAVVKADAYGLGAHQVAGAIGDLVDAFYVFDAGEAIEADLWKLTGKRTIALQGSSEDPVDYLAAGIQPVVWSVDRASALRRAKPVLAVDTGQQRFAASVERAIAIAREIDCDEVMTHATHIEQVEKFLQAVDSLPQTGRPRFLHAAGTALLDEKCAWLSAVRPGLALYRNALKVSTRLVEVRDSSGPAGYTGFIARKFGVILVGYRNGLKAGPCVVNGLPRRIIEVGMQSAFVELGPDDAMGDEVVLIGEDGPALQQIATAWGASQQEVLVRLSGSGISKGSTK